MSDKFVFLREFYDNFRKVTLTTVVIYSLTWSREQLISFHKNEENQLRKFCFPKQNFAPPPKFWVWLRPCKPREETEFDVAGSGVGLETNAKRIGKVSFLQNSSLHNFLILCNGLN